MLSDVSHTKVVRTVLFYFQIMEIVANGMALGIMELLGYSAGGFLLVLLNLFTLFTGYVVYVHSKYDHLPGPKRTR